MSAGHVEFDLIDTAHPSPITSVDFSPVRDVFATGHADGLLKYWRAEIERIFGSRRNASFWGREG